MKANAVAFRRRQAVTSPAPGHIVGSCFGLMTLAGCGDVTSIESDAGPAPDAALVDAASPPELVVAITPESLELFEGDSAELEVR